MQDHNSSGDLSTTGTLSGGKQRPRRNKRVKEHLSGRFLKKLETGIGGAKSPKIRGGGVKILNF